MERAEQTGLVFDVWNHLSTIDGVICVTWETHLCDVSSFELHVQDLNTEAEHSLQFLPESSERSHWWERSEWVTMQGFAGPLDEKGPNLDEYPDQWRIRDFTKDAIFV